MNGGEAWHQQGGRWKQTLGLCCCHSPAGRTHPGCPHCCVSPTPLIQFVLEPGITRVVLIVVPNTTHTNPSHSLSFSNKYSVQFVDNNLGRAAVTNVTTPRRAAPNDCCLPVATQIGFLCCARGFRKGRRWDSIVGSDLQAGNPLSKTLSPPLFHRGGVARN